MNILYKPKGAALVWAETHLQYQYEPGAASVLDRVETIQTAKQAGIRTWVSVEPVIDPAQALRVIETLAPRVDHWKIGKINHCKDLGAGVDWPQFRRDAEALLTGIGASYYLKNSLTGVLK